MWQADAVEAWSFWSIPRLHWLSGMSQHSEDWKERCGRPAPVPLDEKCPVDGAQLVKRFGRFGEFISCSNYPKCKYIKQETTGVSCPRPGCKGEIVVKKSKRGKAFMVVRSIRTATSSIGTSRCLKTCPQCNAPFLLEKTTKKKGPSAIAPTKTAGLPPVRHVHGRQQDKQLSQQTRKTSHFNSFCAFCIFVAVLASPPTYLRGEPP